VFHDDFVSNIHLFLTFNYFLYKIVYKIDLFIDYKYINLKINKEVKLN
jgi:hypothetical protein